MNFSFIVDIGYPITSDLGAAKSFYLKPKKEGRPFALSVMVIALLNWTSGYGLGFPSQDLGSVQELVLSPVQNDTVSLSTSRERNTLVGSWLPFIYGSVYIASTMMLSYNARMVFFSPPPSPNIWFSCGLLVFQQL